MSVCFGCCRIVSRCSQACGLVCHQRRTYTPPATSLTFSNVLHWIGLLLYCVPLLIYWFFLCTATYRYFLQLEMHVWLICVIKLYLLTSNGWGQRHCFQVHCPSVNACLCTWMPRLSYSPVGLPSTIVFLSYFAFSIFFVESQSVTKWRNDDDVHWVRCKLPLERTFQWKIVSCQKQQSTSNLASYTFSSAGQEFNKCDILLYVSLTSGCSIQQQLCTERQSS